MTMPFRIIVLLIISNRERCKEIPCHLHEDGEGEIEGGKSGGSALNPLSDGGRTRAKATLGNGLAAGTLCIVGTAGCV